MADRYFNIAITNIISFLLVTYYIFGFFTFIFHNSRRIYPPEIPQEQLYLSPLVNRDPPPDLSMFISKVSEYSIAECIRLNRKYGTSFDCETTPYSGLRVPYDKLPLDEKIEARLGDICKAVAKLFGRDFWAFSGMHIFLAFFALAPLVVLTVPPLLWRLLCRAWGRKQVMAERPIYRGVVGVFALMVLVLAGAIVVMAMMEKPEGKVERLPDTAIEAYDEMVRNLLN